MGRFREGRAREESTHLSGACVKTPLVLHHVRVEGLAPGLGALLLALYDLTEDELVLVHEVRHGELLDGCDFAAHLGREIWKKREEGVGGREAEIQRGCAAARTFSDGESRSMK